VAELIGSLPARGSRRKNGAYDHLLDGQIWRCTRGVDFDTSISSFRNTIYVAARRRRLKVSVMCLDSESLAVQARTPVKASPPKPPAEKVKLPSFERLEKPAVVPGRADKIFDLLFQEGSLPVELISRRLKLAVMLIEAEIDASDWFQRNADGDIAIKK
jgi:hypothetical protein